MKHKIIGIRSAQGTSKKSNKPFDCYILHCVLDNSNEVDAGSAAVQVFLDKSILKDDVRSLGSYHQLVGLDIDIDRNSMGFVVQAKVIY